MTIVYLARRQGHRRAVAIKVLSESLMASPELTERFRREARTADRLHHQNVITVYDFGEDDRGVPYLVLEYVEGPALGVVLYEMLVGERPFDAGSPVEILLQRLEEPAPSVLLARPELPLAVGDVIDRALLRDSAGRYGSADRSTFRLADRGFFSEVLVLGVPDAEAALPEHIGSGRADQLAG